MFKVLILLFAILFALSMYIVKPISAGGDKNGGDNNTTGTVVQNTNTDFEGICPFDNCPPLETQDD